MWGHVHATPQHALEESETLTVLASRYFSDHPSVVSHIDWVNSCF
jgi:hypothetical protein